tara:strand:+ start:84 stop:389 length:306 start_codon:yes stop_codon:yes gene_type:complete
MNKNDNNYKSFFIKLISISFAIIIIINIVFNLTLADRLDKIDKIFSIYELNERKNLKDKLLNDIEKSLDKDEIINKEDKVIILKLFKKLKKEFKEIELSEK